MAFLFKYVFFITVKWKQTVVVKRVMYFNKCPCNASKLSKDYILKRFYLMSPCNVFKDLIPKGATLMKCPYNACKHCILKRTILTSPCDVCRDSILREAFMIQSPYDVGKDSFLKGANLDSMHCLI